MMLLNGTQNQDHLGSVCFIYFVRVNEAAGYMLVSDGARMLTYPRLRGNSPLEKEAPICKLWGPRSGGSLCWVSGGSQPPFWYFHSVGNRVISRFPIDCPAHPALSFPRFAVHLSASKTSPSKENKTIFHFRNQASWYIRHPP